MSWPATRTSLSLHWIGGGVRSVAVGVSADGSVVVGHAAVGLDEAVKWQAGEMIPLGGLDLPGDDRSYASAVSPDGTVVVGESTATEANGVGVIWRGDDPIEALPGGTLSSATPISTTDGGRIVVAHAFAADGRSQVVRWRGGELEVVAPPAGVAQWRPRGASGDGKTIVGHVAGNPHQGFTWRGGKARLLGAVAGETGSMANAISPDGTVVVGRSGGGTAFRWRAGKMTSLGVVDGYDHCAARAASRNGKRIIGNCWRNPPPAPPERDGRPARVPKLPDASSVAFVWDRAHGMRSIGAVLAAAGKLPAGQALTECFGISADGVTIVGNGHSADQSQEAWLVVLPLDE